MAKKIFLLLLVFIVVILVGQSVIMAGHTDHVKDYMNYLHTEQLHTIQSLIDSTIQAYDLDIVIVITDDTGNKSSRDYADDYYDYNGFGIGSDHSGLLMLINVGEREVWISTTGKAINIFTDTRISNMTESIASYLTNEDYYNACKEYVNNIKLYANMGIPQGQHSQENNNPPASTNNTYFNRVVRNIQAPPVYITAIVISLLATALASLSNKGKVTINHQTYESKGSFEITASHDDYIRESTTKIRIATNKSNSSISSTHKSSSGRSHGGGGRKF